MVEKVKKNSRAWGTNPRAVGTNPRAVGTNPRAVRRRPELGDRAVQVEWLGPQIAWSQMESEARQALRESAAEIDATHRGIPSARRSGYRRKGRRPTGRA